jgi:hypothetical protein
LSSISDFLTALFILLLGIAGIWIGFTYNEEDRKRDIKMSKGDITEDDWLDVIYKTIGPYLPLWVFRVFGIVMGIGLIILAVGAIMEIL